MAVGLVRSVLVNSGPCLRFCSDPPNQAAEHQLQFVGASFQSFVLGRSQKLKIVTEQQEIIQFTGRSERQVQKLPQLDPSGPTTALSDVRRNRERSASHLTGETVSLMLGKIEGCPVNTERHGMAFLPDQKFAEILHQLTPFFDFFAFTYNLLLTTYNSLSGVFQCS